MRGLYWRAAPPAPPRARGETPDRLPGQNHVFGNHLASGPIFRNGYALGQSGDWKKQRGVLVLLSTTGGPPPAGLPILRAGDAAWKAR
jgi:hypothetical protein